MVGVIKTASVEAPLSKILKGALKGFDEIRKV